MTKNEKEMLDTLILVRDFIEAQVDRKIEGKKPNFAKACSQSLNEIYSTLEHVKENIRCEHGVHGQDCFKCYPSEK